MVSHDEEEKKDTLDLRFEDFEAAFKYKTTSELVKAYLVFMMCSCGFIVTHSESLTKYGRKFLGEKLFSAFMKMTFFGHFVAGENREEAETKLCLLNNYNVHSILDYSIEEDMDSLEAVKKQMNGNKSSAEEKKDFGKEEYGGQLVQYKPDEEFADRRENVHSARTFFYESEAICDENAKAFIESIEIMANKDTQGIVAMKLTALGRPQILFQLSEIIVRARVFASKITGSAGTVIHQKLTKDLLKKKLIEIGIKNVDEFVENVEADSDGIINIFPWYGIVNENKELSETFRIPSLKEGRMVPLITQINKNEEEMFRNMIARTNRVIEAAEQNNVYVTIDAEQSYFQPAISRIAMEMMYRYNKKKAIIFNTYQSYLKECFEEIESHMDEAERQNFCFGAKLVRGAYIEQERKRAAQLGYPDPTNPSYEATNEMYYNIVDNMFDRIRCNKDAGQLHKLLLMVASHNEDTIRYVIEQMEINDVHAEDKVIFFAQLLGMSDYITFPLGNAGYTSYKYVPYGPVLDVIPYLSRRAKENRSIMEKLRKEKRLLRKELTRRIVKGQIFHHP